MRLRRKTIPSYSERVSFLLLFYWCHHGPTLPMPLGNAVTTLMSNKLNLNRAVLT